MSGLESRPEKVLLAGESRLRSRLLPNLRQEAFDVIEVTDGVTASQVLAEGKVGLALLDVDLPSRTGIEVVEDARNRGLTLPLLLVSERGSIPGAVDAIRQGADDYLLLPLEKETLLAAIRRALRGRPQRARSCSPQENQARRQAEKMEVLGRLTSVVAHDLNNLMTVLLSSSGVLSTLAELPGAARQFVDQLEQAATRAVGLTRQLLAYSRKQHPKLVPLDLNTIIADLGGLLQRLLPERVQLVLDLHPLLGRTRMQPGQIEQVVMNLVLNARDAMPRGGRLTLQTTNVLLDGCLPGQNWQVPAGPYVMLAVKDTGVGMDEATRAKLFEPFFTTKRPGEGTGLGLSIVREIVRTSGGALEVASEPGQGTTFRVYFPQLDEPTPVEGARQPGEGRQTVLVVEDSDGVRGLVRDILQRQGFDALEARSSLEAQELCARHFGPIHLLVTNAIMPQMSGPALARWMANRYPGIKVLLLSGQGLGPLTPPDVLNADVPLLEKPFTPAAFTRKVRELLTKTSKVG